MTEQVHLCDLGPSHGDFLSVLHDQTAAAPLGWMGAARVQQSLSQTSDSQFDWDLDFNWTIPGHLTGSTQTHGVFLQQNVCYCPGGRWAFVPVLPDLWKIPTGSTQEFFGTLLRPSFDSDQFPTPGWCKTSHRMMLPPPCFNVGVVYSACLLQTWSCPRCSVLASSDYRNFFHQFEVSKMSFVKFQKICLILLF